MTMTATVATLATVVTAGKVNLKAMMWKLIASLTKKESFSKNPRNHVIIVKIVYVRNCGG